MYRYLGLYHVGHLDCRVFVHAATQDLEFRVERCGLPLSDLFGCGLPKTNKEFLKPKFSH